MSRYRKVFGKDFYPFLRPLRLNFINRGERGGRKGILRRAYLY